MGATVFRPQEHSRTAYMYCRGGKCYWSTDERDFAEEKEATEQQQEKEEGEQEEEGSAQMRRSHASAQTWFTWLLHVAFVMALVNMNAGRQQQGI